MTVTQFGIAPDYMESHAKTSFERVCNGVLGALAAADGLSAMADALLERLQRAMPLDRFAWLRQADGGELGQVVVRANRPLVWKPEMQARWHPDFTTPAFSGSRIVVASDLWQESLADEETAAHWLVAEGQRSCVLLPCGPVDGGRSALLLTTCRTDAYGRAQVELLEGLVAPMGAALQRARRFSQLEARVAGAEAYLDTLSGELRTYLDRVGSFADALADVPHDPETRWYVQEVSEGACRLQSLASYGLDAAALAGDVPAFTKAPLDLAALAKDVFRDVSQDRRGGADEGCPSFERCPGDEPLPVEGDRRLLSRALHALLEHACQVTEASGTISLSGGRTADEAWIEVRDTGRGSAKGDQAAQTPGAAPGLAMVKAVAEAHGGRIDVSSQEGLGSTFRLSLPLAG